MLQYLKLMNGHTELTMAHDPADEYFRKEDQRKRDKLREAQTVDAAREAAVDLKELQLELKTVTEDTSTKILHLQFLVYESQLASDVKRGENSGEYLRHQQVVRYLSPTLELQDSSQHEISIDPTWRLENIGVAAMITSAGNNAYLQAVHTPINKLLPRQ